MALIIIYDAENIGTIVIRNLNDGNDSFINVTYELLADSSCGRGGGETRRAGRVQKLEGFTNHIIRPVIGYL